MSRVVAVVNYCTLSHFDAYQCAVSHLPHIPDWIVGTVELTFWALVVLFILSMIERIKSTIVIVYTIGKWLLGPGVQLITDVYGWVKSKAFPK